MVWLNDAFGGKFPITWSLGFIIGTIAVSIIASLLFPAKVMEKGVGPKTADVSHKAGPD
jgi:tellurite resistance protein TerC